MEFRLVENMLSPEDFSRLRESAGWQSFSEEQLRRAMAGGLFTVAALGDEGVIGMGRLVGDGVMYWYLQDVVTLPQYQGLGIGRAIVGRLLDYIEQHALPGTRATVGLMAAEGKEEFYERFGFVTQPSAGHGAGMMRYLDIPERKMTGE